MLYLISKAEKSRILLSQKYKKVYLTVYFGPQQSSALARIEPATISSKRQPLDFQSERFLDK